MSIYQIYDRVVFLDTETTGFDSDKNQMIELAMIATNPEGKTAEFDKFIQLHTEPSIPERITKLTGITDLDVSQGITETEALTAFGEYAYTKSWKTLLVAYNAQFDLNFLAKAFIRHLYTNDAEELIRIRKLLKVFTSADYLDPMTVYKDRREFPHKLKDAITAYGLDGKVENSHRAIDDTKALKAVTEAMAAERDDLESYINVFGYNPKYGVTGSRFKKVKYAAQPFRYGGVTAPEETLPALIKAGKAEQG